MLEHLWSAQSVARLNKPCVRRSSETYSRGLAVGAPAWLGDADDPGDPLFDGDGLADSEELGLGLPDPDGEGEPDDGDGEADEGDGDGD